MKAISAMKTLINAGYKNVIYINENWIQAEGYLVGVPKNGTRLYDFAVEIRKNFQNDTWKERNKI
jgi:hypothetical protein